MPGPNSIDHSFSEMDGARRAEEGIRLLVPAAYGTYALFRAAREGGLVQIGRLGRLRLQSGLYVYVGSALGPGGLRARLAHHCRREKRQRWHIDYLAPHTRLERVWYCLGSMRREHQWASAMGTAFQGAVPLPGFGASDCDCVSHLFFFEKSPSLSVFMRALRRLDAAHPRVHQLSRGTHRSFAGH